MKHSKSIKPIKKVKTSKAIKNKVKVDKMSRKVEAPKEGEGTYLEGDMKGALHVR